MNTDLAFQKSGLRQQLRARLKLITSEQRLSSSAQACDLLRKQAIWRAAKSVLFYAALRSELDLSPLIPEALAEGKTVALPRYAEETRCYTACQIRDFARDCAPGKFGILEPGENCSALALKQLDLVLVPGVGFDATGCRLGRGQGFYDRLLAQVSGIKCGIAYDEQLVEKIPAESHDVRLNFILTPAQWLPIAGDSHAI